MKKVIFILFSLMITNSYSQQGSIKPLKDSALKIIEKRTDFIDKYSDSLNEYNFEKEKKIPAFFLKYNFDRENSEYLTSMNDETSFRKLIIDKVDNIQLLRAVLLCKDRRLKKTIKLPKNTIYGIKAFQGYSTYELVKYRVEELINKYHSGDR